MLQGTDQTEVSEGRSRGWTQFTVMLVQHYDENHRLEVTPHRPIPPSVYFPYLAIMRNKKRGQPLTSVCGQQSGAAPCRRRVNFPPRYSGLIPQWAQLRCRFPPRAPSPDTAVCRSPVGGAVQHAVSRAEWGERTGSCSVVTASPERRGEERREISLWSVAGVASALFLMSTVNAAMQGPGGATAAVQLLLSGIYA